MDRERNFALQQATYGPHKELFKGFLTCKEQSKNGWIRPCMPSGFVFLCVGSIMDVHVQIHTLIFISYHLSIWYVKAIALTRLPQILFSMFIQYK